MDARTALELLEADLKTGTKIKLFLRKRQSDKIRIGMENVFQ